MKEKILLTLWTLLIVSVLYVFIFHARFFENLMTHASGTSVYLAYGLFLLIGALRGFTLIPSTYLIILGLVFFEPIPLFILTITGIMISSLTVYYFFENLDLEKHVSKKYEKYIHKTKKLLSKNELLVVTAWSFIPFLPTDLICYLCGLTKVNVKKFLLGVFMGEATICALYIFSGHSLFNLIQGH